MINVLEIAFQW